jgi:hypothetical protein
VLPADVAAKRQALEDLREASYMLDSASRAWAVVRWYGGAGDLGELRTQADERAAAARAALRHAVWLGLESHQVDVGRQTIREHDERIARDARDAA